MKTFREFWARSAHFGQNGGWGESRGSRVFCVVIQRTFQQLRNGRFSPNLVTKRSSMSRPGIGKDIFEHFHFRGHLPFCPQNLKSKIGQTLQAPHSEQATGHGMHCRETWFTPRCSPRAREFPSSGQLFSTTYGCAATGRQSCPIFGFWPIFPTL